jgi:hypothetical protein
MSFFEPIRLWRAARACMATRAANEGFVEHLQHGAGAGQGIDLFEWLPVAMAMDGHTADGVTPPCRGLRPRSTS